MHLLQKKPLSELDLWEQIRQFEAYQDIELEAREVDLSMVNFETRNTRLVLDVNTGENDLVEEIAGDKQTPFALDVKAKLEDVTQVVKEMRKNRAILYKKNDLLLAPKRKEEVKVSALKEQDKKTSKQKKVKNEIQYITKDHPLVPNVIDLVMTLYGQLCGKQAYQSVQARKNRVAQGGARTVTRDENSSNIVSPPGTQQGHDLDSEINDITIPQSK